MQVVRIYSFIKEIELYIRASYTVFLFVKLENDNFIKEIKHVLRAFIDWRKPRRTLGRIRKQIDENTLPDQSKRMYYPDIFYNEGSCSFPFPLPASSFVELYI